jgi:AcrR family transcriptional regulator
LTGTVGNIAGEVKSSRKYHSPLRADQARATRLRVLDAALELFVDRGYAGTTIAAVAERAGVSAETIYLTFGGKRGLLEQVIETAIAGGDESSADEEALGAALAETLDARERLAAMVDYTCAILARTRPIHTVIRGAADKEPFAAELGSRLVHERLAAQTERVRRHLRGDLRPGLSVAQAGQRYCALGSPELYNVVTVEFGWTADQHRAWLTDLLAGELLAARSR